MRRTAACCPGEWYGYRLACGVVPDDGAGGCDRVHRARGMEAGGSAVVDARQCAFAPARPRIHAHRLAVVAVGALKCANADRKSVVKGKSLSVRVDLGGRRIIKKKHKKS